MQTEKRFEKDSKIYAMYLRCVREPNSVAESRFKIIVAMLEEFPSLRVRVAEYLEDGDEL